MGLFDIFKKKKTEEVAAAPEVAQEVAQTEQAELNTGLEKTKEGFFAKLHCRARLRHKIYSLSAMARR